MIKVLQIFPQMNNAGTEKVIMTLFRNIDRSKVKFDFLIQKDGELDNEIKKMGGVIHKIEFVNKKQYYKELLNFLKKSEYKIIHVHTQGNMELILKAGKEANIPCRIIHSHNSRQDLPKFVNILNLKRNIEISRYATDFFACSSDAAKWLFPFDYKKTKIIYNAIDINSFKFELDKRNFLRKEMNIKSNEKIIVEVGRFAKQKNHIKFVNIAEEILKCENNVRFMLIGEGPLEEKIKELVQRKNIKEKFIFLGNRSDINNLLMAADLFLFPTLHEGLGIVLVEAQFSGLKCITSNNVPNEADIGLGLMEKINLNKSNKYWKNIVLEELEEKIDRSSIISKKFNNNYDINKIISKIQDFYVERNI